MDNVNAQYVGMGIFKVSWLVHELMAWWVHLSCSSLFMIAKINKNAKFMLAWPHRHIMLDKLARPLGLLNILIIFQKNHSSSQTKSSHKYNYMIIISNHT